MKIVCVDEKPIKINHNISKRILMINLKYNLFNRNGQLHRFCSCNSVSGCPMVSPKVIVECLGLSAKNQFKKENPLRRGGGAVFS